MENEINILIIEDSITQAEKLRYILESNDYNVTHAIDAEIAIEILKNQIPDIIISDIVMPGMDGYQFCSKVKTIEQFNTIPIILLTSLSNPQDVMRGLECGADSFLVKPFDEDLLIERIHYFIENTEHRKLNPDGKNLEILFNKEKFNVQSSPRQILDILLATYQNSLLTNRQLIESNKELKLAQDKLSRMNRILEQKVNIRTKELEDTNEHLKEQISERINAEETVQRQYFTLHGIIESVESPIFSIDTEYRYTSYNKVHEGVMKSLYGSDIEVGRNILDYMTVPEDREIAKQNLDKALSGITLLEEAFSGDEGLSRLYFEVSHNPIFYNEKYVIGVAVMARDISDRKKAEQELKDSELFLKELNATKDKFFSIISHDLKNPFNSIIGLSDLLLERIQEKDYTGIEEFANSILDTAQHTMSLLMNLLEWANSQTGKMKYRPEQLNIESLINEVFELVKSSAHEKSIQISTEIPPYCMAYADKAMISTVIRNLVSNAIKFTHPQGEIHISVVQREDEMIVKIADNGVGIDSEKIKDLFRIDKNTSTPGTNNEKGTGLGLILCREFIETHGGEIWAESMVGSGTTISFTLPNKI